MKRKYLSDASYESIELLLKRCLMIESFTIKNISRNNDNTVSTELITKDGIKVITLTNRTVKGDSVPIDFKEYRSFMRENGYVSDKKNKKKMILYFTDLEQDIILLSKGHDFTNDFKERCPKAKDENLTSIDRIILLHQEYYRWGNRICLYVIYESLLDICFKFYDHRHETGFRFKDYLGDIMKNRLTGKYEEFINLEHIINNLMCCITDVRVRKGEEELYKLKGKFVEEE